MTLQINQSHDVNRWHNNPDERLRNSGDTIRKHCARVATICTEMCRDVLGQEPSRELLYAAEHHDDAEYVLGDMPGPAKHLFPELAAAYEAEEKRVRAAMGIVFHLSNWEWGILKIADKLDACEWARNCGIDLTALEWGRAKNAIHDAVHRSLDDGNIQAAHKWIANRIGWKE